jgi:superfamily II DNA or RNA helicase
VDAPDRLYRITRAHIVTHNTVVMAHMIDRHLRGVTTGRVAVLVHRDELVQQTLAKVHSVAPDLSTGVVKAGRNEIDADVVVISVQTIARERRLHAIPADHFSLVICDECHHVSADSYVRALTYFGCIEGMTPFCGFTATLTRMDKRGLGDVIEHVADKRDILWGIRSGHLTDIRPYTTAVDALNLGGVARSSGDFQSSALGSAMVKAHAPAAMARTIAERAPDRQGVSFWPTVATAHLAAHELRTHGRSAAVITGDTSSEERALIFKRVRHGEIQDLVNVMVLTEGFDLPQLSYVAVGKITLNTGLLVQMLGRGLRLSPGKTDCLAFLLEGSSPIPLASLVDLSETTIRQIADGEGLAEAADRQEREDATAEGRVAAVRVTAMDLFARSSSDWMRTERGFWFLPVTNWLIGLIPETELEETYRVVQVWDGKGISQKSRTVWTGMTLEYGMAMGESLAEELDPALTLRSKAASWKRKKSVPVTDAQLSVLRGVPGADRLTKVEASAMISRMFASRKLDRLKVLPT